MTSSKIAILGWGSLLSDDPEQSSSWHGPWLNDGPSLKIEFSRISQTPPRRGVLTLVIDPMHGAMNRVAHCYSARGDIDEAIDDLAKRERMLSKRNIGCLVRSSGTERSHDAASLETIRAWATANDVDAIIWTGLQSNFNVKTGQAFSVAAAIGHLRSLDDDARAIAMDYLRRAPQFVRTPLRDALENAALS